MMLTYRNLWKLPVYALLLLFSCIYLVPLFWLLTTSIKPENQIFAAPPVWWPAQLEWANYSKGLAMIPFVRYLGNTLLICAGTMAGTLLSCSMVAYGLSKLRWRGRDALFLVMLATLMIPAQVTMFPLFTIFRELDWINTYKPLVVPAFLGNAFFIFMLRQFFMTIPNSLIEGARIDGAGEFKIWWSLILPLSTPALMTVGLFTFLNSLNDYMGPLIYIADDRKYTLSLGLAMFSGQYGSAWGPLMAVTTLFTLPVIVLFFFTQKTFIQGIKVTGLK